MSKRDSMGVVSMILAMSSVGKGVKAGRVWVEMTGVGAILACEVF
jgi:hypothetical protein